MQHQSFDSRSPNTSLMSKPIVNRRVMPGVSSRTLGGLSRTGKPKISHVDNNNLQNF
jgi:hypothetical protein